MLYSKEFKEVNDSSDIPYIPLSPKDVCPDADTIESITKPVIKIILKESLQQLCECFVSLHKVLCSEVV